MPFVTGGSLCRQPPGTEDLRTFLTLWLLLPILFFSLSQSKLPGYILPSVPAGTILLADFIRRREEAQEKPNAWLSPGPRAALRSHAGRSAYRSI